MKNDINLLLKDIGKELLVWIEEPGVTEIIFNRPDEDAFVFGANGMRRVPIGYDAGTLEAIIKLFASAAQKDVANDKGQTSALNATYSMKGNEKIRIAALLPRYSVDGASMSIRRHSAKKLSLDKIAIVEKRKNKEIPEELTKEWNAAEYLRAAVAAKRNILISGSTDSGKTTFANALMDCVPDDVRLLTIEDAQELKPQKPNRNYVQFLSDADAGVSSAFLLKLALRYRPDAIIVGEVRGGEAYDLVEAWGTGHDGGISTIHANDAEHALLRLQGLVLDGAPGQLSEISAKTKICSAVDVIVHLWRSHSTGQRRIGEIITIKNCLNSGDFCFNTINLSTHEGKSHDKTKESTLPQFKNTE